VTITAPEPALDLVAFEDTASVRLALAWFTGTVEPGTETTVRTNYVTNPRAALDTAGWTAAGGTLTRVTTSALGATAFQVSATGGASAAGSFLSVPALPAETWSASARARTTTAGTYARVSIEWRQSTTVLSTTHGTIAALSTTADATFTVTGTAPSNTDNARIRVFLFSGVGGANPTAGQIIQYVDVLTERAATPGAYFDGDTTDTADTVYAWTGAANSSSSTATTTTVTGEPELVPGPQLGFATVARVSRDGVVANVRDAEPAELDAENKWVGFDYEPPLDIPFYYFATSTAAPGETVLSAEILLASGGRTWLRHPGRPALSTQLTLVRGPALSRPIETGVFNVQGRSRAIAVTARRQSERGTLEIDAATEAENLAIVALIEDGATLLLTTPAGAGLPGNMYVVLGEATEERYTGYGFEPSRRWSIPFIVVDRPEGPAAPFGNSWSDAFGGYASWHALLVGEETWSDLLAGVST
jgi:hypothetical protein